MKGAYLWDVFIRKDKVSRRCLFVRSKSARGVLYLLGEALIQWGRLLFDEGGGAYSREGTYLRKCGSCVALIHLANDSYGQTISFCFLKWISVHSSYSL